MTIAAIAQATAAAVFALVILSVIAPQTAAIVALIVCPLFIGHTLYTTVRDLMTGDEIEINV
jgi:xanthosine utilization system XapX-like protein